jgi:cyclopropane fatty-acyl-phospholipid synthase-like methyltransferase
MRKLETIRHTWKFVSPLPPFWRLHQTGRSLLLPFHQLLRHLPVQESPHGLPTLLDLGCGHGVFLALAKRENPNLQLIGLDLSDAKIAAARQAFDASSYSIPQLAVMDIADFPEQSVDIITIIDVLYLVPINQWDDILKKCYKCLKSGGKILLKEMDRSITWKFMLLYLEETLAVKILGLTLGKRFTFPEPGEIRCRLERAGFVVEACSLHRGNLVPHHLWIGSK